MLAYLLQPIIAPRVVGCGPKLAYLSPSCCRRLASDFDEVLVLQGPRVPLHMVNHDTHCPIRFGVHGIIELSRVAATRDFGTLIRFLLSSRQYKSLFRRAVKPVMSGHGPAIAPLQPSLLDPSLLRILYWRSGVPMVLPQPPTI